MLQIGGASVYEEGLKRYSKHSRLNYIGKLAIQDIDGKEHFRSSESRELINAYVKSVIEDIKNHSQHNTMNI